MEMDITSPPPPNGIPNPSGPTFPFNILPPMKAAAPTNTIRILRPTINFLFCIFSPWDNFVITCSSRCRDLWFLDCQRVAVNQDPGNDPISALISPDRDHGWRHEIIQRGLFYRLLNSRVAAR